MVQCNPQAVHTRFCCSLQHKLSYLQLAIEVDPEKYAVLDIIIQAEPVLTLFNTDEVPETFNQPFQLPIKQSSIGILSPKGKCDMNQLSSLESM
eukprot:12836810-Ditylum_brightwellii.AAC.1